jgi:hypothetical protein
MTVSPVTKRFSYPLFYRNLMSRLPFFCLLGKTYTCKTHHLGVSVPTLYRWLPAGARESAGA